MINDKIDATDGSDKDSIIGMSREGVNKERTHGIDHFPTLGAAWDFFEFNCL